jgi:ERCC4-type nuclease
VQAGLMLIAPTERELIKRNAGRVTLLPERFGCDILFTTPHGLAGVQRKEIRDLIQSVRDGRLGKELAQMQQLAHKMLVVEGRVEWTMDGTLMAGNRGEMWTRSQHLGLMMTVQHEGVWVMGSADVDGTLEIARAYEAWLSKVKHGSVLRRPAAQGAWGTATSKEFGLHLLMGLPNVGRELAERMWVEFGGVPWVWKVTEVELAGVKGIGKKKAAQIYKALGG